MKHLLLTTIAAVLLVGCGESQQSTPSPEAKPVEPVAEASQAEPPTAKAPDTSIHDAAKKGNIEAVKQHIAAGTDVNAKTRFRWTPLHSAARYGHKEVAELLISKGAEVNAKTKRAKDDTYDTPLDWAIVMDETKIADILRKHGGKMMKELEAAESIHAASRYENIEAVKQHLAAGMDVDTRDAEDKTPLQHAAFGGYKEITELLIAASADVNTKDELLMTPLHPAAAFGHKEIAELLIAKGADVNAKDEGGDTPLDWAIVMDETKIADILRKHGGKTGAELKAEEK